MAKSQKTERIFSPGPGWRVVALITWPKEGETQVGDWIMGVYKGTEEVHSRDPKKENDTFLAHKILVDSDKEGAANPDLLGKLVSVSGAALTAKLSALDADTEVCLVYKGMAKSKNNRNKDFKDFEVYTR